MALLTLQCRKRATKNLAITKLPDILVVHLKCFPYGKEEGAKIYTLLDSPYLLDLTRYVSTPPTSNKIGHTPPLVHYQLYNTLPAITTVISMQGITLP